MSQQEEYLLQMAVTDYIKIAYPGVQFRCDMAGVRLTKKPAWEIKRIQKSRGFPDLFICKMSLDFGGAFIELKTSRDEIFTKSRHRLINGKATHILEQCAVLLDLNDNGYAVGLSYGYEEAVGMIDYYLRGEWNRTFYQFINIKEAVVYATEEQWQKALLTSPVNLTILEKYLRF